MNYESFSQGVKQFNQRQFYECHDTLEAIWIEAPEMDKRFYQGILQVAVACYHLSNKNLRGAIILLGEGIRRLSDYQPDYQSIDVTMLLEESIGLQQTLQQIAPERVNDLVQQLFSDTHTVESCKLPQLIVLKSENN
jgi:predicted metal-dependent hydrolase